MSVPTRRAARLLMMGWDGLRPDLISSELTPNLWALAAQGAFFEKSHAVVPTVTRCNAATLASGAPPSVHGLPANQLHAPLVDAANLVSFGDGDSFERLRAEYNIFTAPTIADAVANAGGRSVIVSSGSRGCAYMLNPRRRERGELILHPTLSMPSELAPIVERLGPLPPAAIPDTAINAWLTRAAEIVIPEQRPDALFYWHDDPDKTQHRHGFGHPLALSAIRDADRNLGILLASLDAAGLLAETVIAVVSDHGYINVQARVDLRPAVAAADPGGQIVVAPNGSAAMVFANGADDRTLAAVVRSIQTLPEVGVIFSGSPGRAILDGTFPLAAIGAGGPLGPDLLVTAAWSDDLSEHGPPGMSFEFNARIAASHGGASAWEIRNSMILAGPGVRRGVTSTVPSGSVDLAPTLLDLLGLARPASMTGRVLTEALEGPALTTEAAANAPPAYERIETSVGPAFLRWSDAAGSRYLDAAWVERGGA